METDNELADFADPVMPEEVQPEAASWPWTMNCTSGEFAGHCEKLGLGTADLAALLHVSLRTARAWMQGRDPIPGWLADKMHEWMDSSDRLVAHLVHELGVTDLDEPDEKPALIVYPRSSTLWDNVPGTEPWPAGWWKAACQRAVDEYGRARLLFPEEVFEK